MKVLACVVAGLLSVLSIGWFIRANILNSYEYERDIGSHWELADKQSTLPAKVAHIRAFIEALDQEKLYGMHAASVFETPDNGFDQNYAALKTLRQRIEAGARIDESSMAYQTAIQQITAQEVGEAQNMLKVFEGCWTRKHYIFLFGWWWGVTFAGLAIGNIFVWLLAAATFE